MSICEKKISARARHLLTGLAVVGFGMVVYSNTLHSSFHFDDFRAIVENKEIRSIADPKAIFDAYNTRFLTGMSFALNYYLHGLDTYGYHLFNAFIHILTSLLVYRLVLSLFQTKALIGHKLAERKTSIAVVAAFIFLLHPVQTQAVTYIWQRTTSMASFFYLAGIHGYLSARINKKRFPFFIPSFFCVVAAMLTKEITFTAPLALLFCEIALFPKEPWKKKALMLTPFLMTLLIIPGLLTHSTPKTMGITQSAQLYFDKDDPTWRGRKIDITRGAETQNIRRTDYFLTECRAMVTYLRLIILPIRQNLDYDLPISGRLSDPETLFSVLFMGAFIISGLWFLKPHLLLFFSFFWFFLTISVESSFIPVLDPINEHRLYLPMAGASIFLAAILTQIVRKKKAFLMISVLLLAALAVLTYRRNAVWQSNVTLWQDIVKKSPGKSRARVSLAKAYVDEGFYDKAIAEAEKALAIDPENAQAYIALANAHNLNGQQAVAAGFYEKGLAIDPYDLGARYNLAVIKHSEGNFREAAAHLQKILSVDDKYVNAYLAFGALAAQKGKGEEAIAFFKKAARLDPEDPVAYHNIGVTYGRMGKASDEIYWYQKAIATDRSYAKTWRELGLAYEREEEFDKAKETYQTMLSSALDKGFACHRLGVIAAISGETAGAEEYFRQALLVLPENADLLYDAAVFYLRNENAVRAREITRRLNEIGRSDLAGRLGEGSSGREEQSRAGDQ